MIVRHFSRELVKRWPEWDKTSKTSLALAVALLILLLILGFLGPQPLRFPARIGAFGLLLTLQLLLFWANRRVISPYHQAQQHFLRGDFGLARDILERLPEGNRASVDVMILLGNCYRQLGQFDQSRAAVDNALRLKPDYHYALYAAGKLWLTGGEYQAARGYLERALGAGAPDLVWFDLGQACYLNGDHKDAEAHFDRFCVADVHEPEKMMLLSYYRYQIGSGEFPDAQLISTHIGYWETEAHTYRQSAYGAALKTDIDRLYECN